jgi:hypothetical protein
MFWDYVILGILTFAVGLVAGLFLEKVIFSRAGEENPSDRPSRPDTKKLSAPPEITSLGEKKKKKKKKDKK